MTRLKWLTVFTLLVLGASELSAEDQQTGRHFNVNPNNMMGGMMNPMRNMFGGYDRDRGGYNNYNNTPYYGPQAYPGYPQGQPYPGGYAQPPASYNTPAAQYPANPGYQQPVQQPSPTPSYREQASPRYQPAPATGSTKQYGSAPQEQFRFRPIEQQAAAQNSAQTLNTPYQQAPTSAAQTPSAYYNSPTSPQGIQQPPAYQSSSEGASASYTPYNEATEQLEPTMKFRPLDQPGYSQ
ncbi:MAG: hypothetical protein ABW104_10850 [Candidatus Thiodiazotropha sp. 6PLUC2]